MTAHDAPPHRHPAIARAPAWPLAVLLLAAPWWGTTPVHAQGAAAALEGATIISRDVIATAGETPLDIARRELGSAAFARPLAEFNGREPGDSLAAGDVVRIPIHVPARGETARVAFVKGDVSRAGAPLASDELIAEGDVVVTGIDGFVSILFSPGSVVNLQPNTTARIVRLACLESDDSCLIDIATERGEIKSDVQVRDGQPVDFRVTTPFASAAVRGTVFETIVGTETLRAAVTEGAVDVAAEGEEVELPSGFGSVTREGEPPGEPVELLPAPVFRVVPNRVAAGDALKWFDLTGAIAYTALLSLDEGGVETVAEPSVIATRLELGPEIEAGDYYVSLRGVDVSDLPGNIATVRVGVAAIDPDVAAVATTITREGGDFLVEVIDPPADAPGFEIQIDTSEEFDDPLAVDVAETGRAVLRLDADVIYARARTLIDPETVSAFGPVSRSE